MVRRHEPAPREPVGLVRREGAARPGVDCHPARLVLGCLRQQPVPRAAAVLQVARHRGPRRAAPHPGRGLMPQKVSDQLIAVFTEDELAALLGYLQGRRIPEPPRLRGHRAIQGRRGMAVPAGWFGGRRREPGEPRGGVLRLSHLRRDESRLGRRGEPEFGAPSAARGSSPDLVTSGFPVSGPTERRVRPNRSRGAGFALLRRPARSTTEEVVTGTISCAQYQTS
jgi:hypothetical protein